MVVKRFQRLGVKSEHLSLGLIAFALVGAACSSDTASNTENTGGQSAAGSAGSTTTGGSGASGGTAGVGAAGQGGTSGAGAAGGGAGGASVSHWAPQSWEDCEANGRALSANPTNYRDVIDALVPGDVLTLETGDYARGLPVRVSGTPEKCIVIQGAASGGTRILGSDAFNLVALYGASYVKIRNLVLSGDGKAGFGVASQGAEPVHHILVENLDLAGFDADQQIVGISTKTPAHHWVIRGNRISGAGTGLYLGNSDGTLPFYAGVIEFNSVSHTVGYSMQIKHQLTRPSDVADGAETLIRYNVFSKGSESSSGGSARPNLLLGHQPTSGSGSNDRFVVYSNFFYDNPTEMLFQAEGNLVVFNNLFVNPNGGAITIQPHNATPRQVDVFFNTILANGTGLRITGGDSAFTQKAFGNASFGPTPYALGSAQDNVEGSLAEAAQSFASASTLDLSTLDLHPQGNALSGASIPASEIPSGVEASSDFDDVARDFTRRGAYSGPAASGAWKPSLDPRSY
ncbi:MAG: right-handed parallel beta-helix repeat-containing protein [Polyangiaceae bacterium]